MVRFQSVQVGRCDAESGCEVAEQVLRSDVSLVGRAGAVPLGVKNHVEVPALDQKAVSSEGRGRQFGAAVEQVLVLIEDAGRFDSYGGGLVNCP